MGRCAFLSGVLCDATEPDRKIFKHSHHTLHTLHTLHNRMNLFLLHVMAQTAADLHCDVHVCKMIVEILQVLYTALRLANTDYDIVARNTFGLKPYKNAHKHHPVTLWVAAARPHCKWALELGLALCDRFFKIYGHHIKCFPHLHAMQESRCYNKLPLNSSIFGFKTNLTAWGVPAHVIDAAIAKRSFCNPPDGCVFSFVCVEFDDKAAIDDLFEKVVGKRRDQVGSTLFNLATSDSRRRVVDATTLWRLLEAQHMAKLRSQVYIVDDDGYIDGVGTYRGFIAYKAKRKFVFAWDRSPTPPPELEDAIVRVLPDHVLLTKETAPARKRKADE